jgi:hypothetical protein
MRFGDTKPLGAFEIQLEDLMVGLAVVLGLYAWVLLIVMRQRHTYMDLLSQLLPRLTRRQEEGVEPAVRLP